MEMHEKCCQHHNFPIFPCAIFIVGLIWLLADLKVIALNLPWLPIIIMVISAAMMFKFYHMKKMKKD